MDQKLDFVLACRSGTLSISAPCRLFGISRQTGHKWLKRFSPRDGAASLKERSRKPLRNPEATPALLAARIVAYRRQHPTWGARKLLWLLRIHWPKALWPAPSTVTAILKRHGLVRPRKRRHRLPARTQPFSHCAEPNDVWCVDFKGQFRTGDGSIVYPLTVTDACSRFILACVALHGPKIAPTRAAFEKLFRLYGLPKAIRSDNGEPFVAAGAPAGLSRLSAWWTKLGIQLERIDPGEPQQNGRHERMHLTLKLETASPPQSTIRAQALAFDRFRRAFNQQRPHEALGMKTPASIYRESPRFLPPRVTVPQYPFADLCIVDSSGSVRWGNRKTFISSSLVGEPLGVYVLDGRYAEVRFANLLLGIIDTEDQLPGLIRPKPPRKRRVSAMSPV